LTVEFVQPSERRRELALWNQRLIQGCEFFPSIVILVELREESLGY
jgi:hypothetical protein